MRPVRTVHERVEEYLDKISSLYSINNNLCKKCFPFYGFCIDYFKIHYGIICDDRVFFALFT